MNRRLAYLSSNQWKIVLMMVVLLLISSACQSSSSIPVTATPASSAVSGTGASSKSASVPSTATPASGARSATVDVVFGSGSFNYPNTKAGLEDLASYKATLNMSFNGTRDGKAYKWSKTYVMQSTMKPATLMLTIKKTGDLADLNSIFMAQADGVDYQRREKYNCTATAIEQGNSHRDQLEPAGFLTFVIGADKTGSETVNNVATTRYTFDERASGQLGRVRSSGEMWVASEGNYIVKYLLTTKGDASYFGQGIEGALTLDYALTDINLPIKFELPDDCPAGKVNAPLLPDASNVLNMPGILVYDTVSSLTDVAGYYQKQLPNLGWTPVDAPTIAEKTALIEFTQESQTMTIIITNNSKGRAVQIMLGKTLK